MVSKKPTGFDKNFKPLVEKDTQLLESLKDITVDYCPISEEFRLGKTWKKATPERLQKFITQAIKVSPYTELKDTQIVLSEDPLENCVALVQVTGEVDGAEEYQEYEVPYTIKRVEKPSVSKEKSGKYYEGMLQFRGAPKDMIDYTIAQIAQSSDVFASKIVEKGAEVDFYLSNNTWLRQMGARLQKMFGGTLKADASLHTYDHQKSKELHRLTVTIFCFPFTKYDMVIKDAELFNVETVHKVATLKNMHTQQKISVDAQEAREYDILPSRAVRVVRVKPTVAVLHPFTYQEVEPDFILGEYSGEDELEAIIYNDAIFVKKKK